MAFSGSINFISASDHGRYIRVADGHHFFGATKHEIASDSDRSSFIPVDFVGLNTIILDPITGSQNYLGHSLDVPVGLPDTDPPYFNSGSTRASGLVMNTNPPYRIGRQAGLNSILLNRNGPYQHPSWKQIRGGDHPVARKLRLNNTMSVDINNPDPFVREAKKKLERERLEDKMPSDYTYVPGEKITGTDDIDVTTAGYYIETPTKHPGAPQQIKQFYSSVITSKHLPLEYEVEILQGEVTKKAKVRASFMNKMMDFSNNEINSRLKFSSGDPTTGSSVEPGKQIQFKSSNQEVYSLIQMAKEASGVDFVYSERIFPREINSYRGYKLERPNFEQTPGLDGYDSTKPRLFWKNIQGGDRSGATSDGSTRLRTDGVAKNSSQITQITNFPENYDAALSSSARQLISSSVNFVSAAYGESPGILGTASYSINVVTNSLDLGLDGLVVEYINNGVVVNRYQTPYDTAPLSGHAQHVSGVLFQLDSYQPYQPSLLSAWPLDARNDIYSKPHYLTSSIGGKGLQIGLTPHRNNTLANNSAAHHSALKLSGSHPQLTSSIISLVSGLQTASAGELVYSTKPTIFFWRNTNTHSTASMSFVAGFSTTTNQLFAIPTEPEEKFELQDAQGNRVGFHFIANSSTADGSTIITSGSTFVQVGFNGIPDTSAGTQTLFRRVETAVNGVNSTANGLTLNISASYHLDASSRKILVFHQTTPGTGPASMLVTASLDNAITGPKFMLTNINIFAGSYIDGSTDTDDMFKALGNGSTGSLRDDGIMGYTSPTASLQYNRHTFPYNTPFYVTDRVRGEQPFYNSYSDFIDSSLKHFGRDYSLFSEFRYSQNINYYNNQFATITDREKLLYVIGNTYTNAFNNSRKFLRGVLLKDIKEDLFYKANSRTIEGKSTGSADNETILPSKNIYQYNEIDGPILQTSTGPAIETYLSDFSAVSFDNQFEKTDLMRNFSFMLDEQVSGFSENENTIPERISFDASVIKKLLPYNGFYPVTRTMQIGNAFVDAISGSIEGLMSSYPEGQVNQGENGPAYIQTVLEPFMAPGILYNSIKSGVAVDYPYYTKKPKYFIPNDFVSGNNDNTNGLNVSSLMTTYHGGLYMMGASRCYPSILTSLPDRRLPFEALYSAEKIKSIFRPDEGNPTPLHLVSDFIDLDRANASGPGNPPEPIYSTDGEISVGNPIITLSKLDKNFQDFKRSAYFSMINNYLSETMQFFLETQDNNSKLPIAVSGLVPNDTSFSKDTVFTMQASLRQARDQVTSEGPRKAGIGNPEGALGRTSAGSGLYIRNSTMRGYIYGPPIEVIRWNTSTEFNIEWNNKRFDFKDAYVDSTFEHTDGVRQYSDYLAANLQDPAYHAFTPPYFYGKSSVVYRFKPEETIILTTEEVVQRITRPDIGEDKKTFFLDEYETPISGTNSINDFILDDESLTLGVPVTGSVSVGSTAKMKINSTVPTSGKMLVVEADNIKDSLWAVSPEWVCPVLDFSGSHSAYRKKVAIPNPQDNYNLIFGDEISTLENTFHSVNTGRGMWGGYGTDPYDSQLVQQAAIASQGSDNAIDKGIYFSIEPFTSIQDTADEQLQESTFVSNQDNTKFSSLLEVQENSNEDLLNILNFEKKEYEVGKFAQEKQISEALLIIPYVEKQIHIKKDTTQQFSFAFGQIFDKNSIYQTREIIPGKHFLPINEKVFENILSLYILDKDILDSPQTSHLYGTKGDPFSKNLQDQSGNDSFLSMARKEAISTDIGQMIDHISVHSENNGYLIPPEFDFVHNKDIAPFQMMIIPFHDSLNKQDLIDIYQGIMPQNSKNITKDMNSFTVNPNFQPKFSNLYVNDFPEVLSEAGITNFLSPGLFLDDIFDNLTTGFQSEDGSSGVSGIPVLTRENSSIDPSLRPYKTAKEFYRNLRFMVFKVKQRAKKDYQNYKLQQIHSAVQSKIDQGIGSPALDLKINLDEERKKVLYKTPADVYGSNWPYDHFSLIESGKIDIKITVKQ